MDMWILRPRFEKRLGPPRLPVKILRLTPDGKESELEDLTLQRGSTPETWEQEGLLDELVQGQIEKGRRGLILDLSSLEKVDSSGIGEIVAAFRLTTESGGKLVLANLRPKVRDICRRTELDRVIPVYDSIADAVLHLGS